MQDENGNWVLAPDESKAIAVYNDKGYMSLQSAIDAAGNGPANVSLLDNTAEAVTIPVGANIAIDIAEGVTLTGTASDHVITNNGTLTVTGEGTVNSDEQAVQNWHKATITGGTISGPVISWAYDDKLGMDNTLDISGTAVVNGDVMSVTYDGAVPQVAITGGTVNGSLFKGQYGSNGIQALPNDSDQAGFVVSGGTFNNAVPEEFCAENFHPNRNPDGSYSVHVHQFGPWVTTVRPGHTTSGTEVQTCTVCGYEIARTIAPTGNNDHPDIEQAKQDGTWGQEETSTPAPTATAAPAAGSVNTVPQTGDEMPLAVLGGAAALAAAAMVVLILRKRRVF